MVEKIKVEDVGGVEFGRMIELYYGRGDSPYPQANKSRVVKEFGEAEGERVECLINEVVGYMDSLCPDWSVYSLSSIGVWVRSEMKLRYPGLDEKSLDVLVWIFTWWWK